MFDEGTRLIDIAAEKRLTGTVRGRLHSNIYQKLPYFRVKMVKHSAVLGLVNSHYRGVDFFPAVGSQSLQNSREHTSPNFLSISVNTNAISVCGSPIREFSNPGRRAIESQHYSTINKRFSPLKADFATFALKAHRI